VRCARQPHPRTSIYTVPYRWSVAPVTALSTPGGDTQPMAAITRTPRSRWIEEGLRALAAGGPDAVRVEALAQALGVTKGGFYGHFADRGALLAEMLDSWEQKATDEVLGQHQHLAEQPAQRPLVPSPEPGDGGVIGPQPARAQPVGHIAPRTASRSPGWTARPGSRRTAAAPSSSPGRTPPGHDRRPGTGGGTHPDPAQPPHPARCTPGRPWAATRACPPAAATADHAAGKGNSAA
jgi:hypothetical protein